ncbi:MAG: bifunctional phosphopantothenoylcysteine decarboxylase/phosphopantothenate--cysteine ligase CoaBC [Clostridia bacterium]|nr:bifunctional phosphopantothenoylcysteine decarboxylase/phosphopantothenate--cysteine ligase CoaBC [Clostridia bacterium]
MLKGKNIIIGITGGIAVYKVCDIVSKLVKLHANVDVIMTKNATEFVSPLTFESLSHNPVVTDMFNRTKEWEIEHISFAKKAHTFVIVPATANIIGKLAQGIADDMLTTTLLATKSPVIIAPAMNTDMYTNHVFQSNLATLHNNGAIIVQPATGRLACGDNGVGKLADVDVILSTIIDTVMPQRDLLGRRVLITAGATIEKIDAVRYISNFSTGKMGIALAKNARDRGAIVTLVLGSHSVPAPDYMDVVNVTTTQQMYDEVLARVKDNDIIIKSAAPCDYKVEHYADTKHKEEHLTLSLVKNPDIARQVGKIKDNRILVVFSAETENTCENAYAKLQSKNADLVVANCVLTEGAGFGTDTNIVTLIDRYNTQTALPIMSKEQVASRILDAVVKLTQ